MFLWSTVMLCAVTVVTRMFKYPEYMLALDEWRDTKSREEERVNILFFLY